MCCSSCRILLLMACGVEPCACAALPAKERHGGTTFHRRKTARSLREWPLGVAHRRSSSRSHGREADSQGELPDSRRPRSAVADPKLVNASVISPPESRTSSGHSPHADCLAHLTSGKLLFANTFRCTRLRHALSGSSRASSVSSNAPQCTTSERIAPRSRRIFVGC